MWAIRICILFFATGALFGQQHSYTPAEIEDGKLLYQTNCGSCHGVDGNAISGAELGRGQFRRASSDEDLVRLIRTGIPGTAMPPHNFTEPQLGTIVAYLRNMSGPASGAAGSAADARDASRGDAVRGQAIFQGKGQCLSCHSVGGAGSRLGPDLTGIGAVRQSAAELELSIVDPGAEVRAENRFFRVVTRQGATNTGRLLNQDTFSLQLLDSRGQLASFMKANLREFAPVATPMPSYRDSLTEQELADLVRYLVSLKGGAP